MREHPFATTLDNDNAGDVAAAHLKWACLDNRPGYGVWRGKGDKRVWVQVCGPARRCRTMYPHQGRDEGPMNIAFIVDR